MSNIRAVDPDVAWSLFKGWAAERLRYEPAGVTLTLVDFPALRGTKPERRRSTTILPAPFLRSCGHEVEQRSNGMWRVDKGVLTPFQLLELINYYREQTKMPVVTLENLRLE